MTLIRLKSLLLVLVVIGSMPMPICRRFHERLVNNGKITVSYTHLRAHETGSTLVKVVILPLLASLS